MCHPPPLLQGGELASAAAEGKDPAPAIDVDASPSSPSLSPSSDRRYQRRIRAAKRAARSELSVSRGEWTREGYHEKRERVELEQDPTALDGIVDAMPRVDLSTTSTPSSSSSSSSFSSFASLFESPRIPCVLTRSAIASWPAVEGARSWIEENNSGLEALVRRYDSGRRGTTKKPQKLKVGTDDDGRAVYLSVADFARYCRDPRHGLVDDSPLYIFDSGFASDDESDSSGSSSESESDIEEEEDEEKRVERERRQRRREAKKKEKKKKKKSPSPPSSLTPLSEDYAVPDPFAEDLLSLAGARRRPPHRWLVAGPPRSGSAPHVDPLGTSAWNSLLSGGVKRWALFPPGVPREAIVGPRMRGVGREAADWFSKVLARIKGRCRLRGGGTSTSGGGVSNHSCSSSARSSSASSTDTMKLTPWPWAPPIEIIQRPGETVIVPGGWWHAVINCGESPCVAVTQNYCCSSNFSRVWPLAAHGRPKMARAWLRELRKKRPELAREAEGAVARALDGASGSSSSSSPSSSPSSSSEDETGGNFGRGFSSSGTRSMPPSPPPASTVPPEENGNGEAAAERSCKRRNVEEGRA